MAANLNRVLSSTPVIAEESSPAGPRSLYSSSVAASNPQTLLGDASLNSLPTSMSSFSNQDYSGSVDINGRRRSSSTSVLSSFKTAVNENANGFYPNQLHLDPKEKSQSSFNFPSKSFASSTLAQGPIVSGERKRPISSASSEPFLNDHRQVQLHSHSTSGSHSEPQTAHPSNESQFWESANQINPEAVFYPTFLGRNSSRSMTLPSSINSPFNLSNQSMLPEAFTAGPSPNGNGNGGHTQDQSVNGEEQEEGPASEIWKEFTRIAQEGIGSSTEESENEEEVELEQAQAQAQAHRLPSMSNGSTSLPNSPEVGGKEVLEGQNEEEESSVRQGTAPREVRRSRSPNTVQDRDEARSEQSVEETVGKVTEEKTSEEVEKEVDEIETKRLKREGKEKEKRNEEENENESGKEKRKESEEKNEIESEKEKEKDKDNDKLELTKTEDGLLPRLDEKAALEKFNSITLDPKGRPNCSYAIAIRLAILSSPGQELDLQKIYSTLMDKFKFYSDMGPKFKNSVRYNLTINRAFIKIARDDGFKPGNVWKVNEDVKPGKIPPKRSLKKRVKKEETASEDEEETKVIQNGIGKNKKRSREEQESNSPDSRHEKSRSEMNRGRDDRSSRQVGRYESSSRAVDSSERSGRRFETAAPRVEPSFHSSFENGQTSKAFGRDHHRSSSSLRPVPQPHAQSLPKSIISTLSGAAEQNFSGRRRSSILPSINSLLPEEPFNANLASEVGNRRGDQSPYNHNQNSKHLHQAHTSNPFTYSTSSSTTAAPSISLYTSTPSPSHSSPRHSIQFNFPPTSLPGPPNQAGESIFASSQRDRASRDVSERRPDYSRREVGPSRTSIGPSWAGMGLGSRLNSASSNHVGLSLNAPNDDDSPLESELEPSLSSFMRKRRISSDSAKLINGLLTKNRHASYTLERRMSEKSLRLEEDRMKEGDALDRNSNAQDQVNRINGSGNEGRHQLNGSQVDTRSENRIRSSLSLSLQVPQAPQVPAEWSNFDSNSSRRRSSGLGLGSNRPSSIYQSISPGTDPTQGQNSPFRWNVTSENRVGPSENGNPNRQTTSNQSVSESPFPPDYRPVTAFSRDSNPPVNKFEGTNSSTSNVNKNGTSIPTLPPFEKNFSLSNPSNAQSNTLSAISPLASSSNPPEWNYQSFNPPHTSSPLAQNPVTNFPSLSNRPNLSSTPTSLASPFSSPLSRSQRDLPALDSPRSLNLNSNPFDTSLNSRFK